MAAHVILSALAISTAATLAAAHGQSPDSCTITSVGMLQYVDLSVQNPVTKTTETQRVYPTAVGDKYVAQATVNAPHNTNVTASYVFSFTDLVPPHSGSNPLYERTVGWLGHRYAVYSMGFCLLKSDFDGVFPSGTEVYEDEQRSSPYTLATYTVKDAALNLSGFVLSMNWFDPIEYPNACRSAATHGTAPLTQCIVPGVILSATSDDAMMMLGR